MIDPGERAAPEGLWDRPELPLAELITSTPSSFSAHAPSPSPTPHDFRSRTATLPILPLPLPRIALSDLALRKHPAPATSFNSSLAPCLPFRARHSPKSLARTFLKLRDPRERPTRRITQAPPTTRVPVPASASRLPAIVSNWGIVLSHRRGASEERRQQRCRCSTLSLSVSLFLPMPLPSSKSFKTAHIFRILLDWLPGYSSANALSSHVRRRLDPLFAIGIGTAAALARIGREEKEKGRGWGETWVVFKRRLGKTWE